MHGEVYIFGIKVIRLVGLIYGNIVKMAKFSTFRTTLKSIMCCYRGRNGIKGKGREIGDSNYYMYNFIQVWNHLGEYFVHTFFETFKA